MVFHNTYLAKKFDVHIIVQVFAEIQSVKYLFKYIYKGQDRAAIRIHGLINEIKQYIDAWYLSASEAVDSLFFFKKYAEWPLVTRLGVHLPGQHNDIFHEDEDLAVVAQRGANEQTTLIGYFTYNAAKEGLRGILYTDFPRKHVWKARKKY